MKFLIGVISVLLLTSQPALAKVNVLACEAEWAALAITIGGPPVTVHSATTAHQDPHHVQARPSLIAKTRRADILICSGSELEAGWLPVLLRKSGNAKIQPGRPGYLMAAEHVDLLDIPESVDRSAGDVHASGNPHIHTNPQHMLTVAKVLSEKLAIIDSEHSEDYRKRYETLKLQLEDMLSQRKSDIEKLKGKSIVVHHDNWLYLAQWLELEKVATLEPKPGIPPSSGHLSSLISQLKAQPANLIIYASYQDDRASKWLSGRTGLPKVALPYSVANWQGEGALILWYQELINKLLVASP